MNILTDRLPDSVEIGGWLYPLRTGYRCFIRFEEIMLDQGLPGEEKLRAALEACYGDIPPDIGAALEAAFDFYRCGRVQKHAGGESGKRLYSFEHDAAYIHAAFLEQYGINLSETDMHWWKFRALFDALSPETLFVRIMGWRGAKIDSKLLPEEKRRLQKLKKLYALPVHQVSEETSALEQALMNGGDVSSLLP